MNNVRNLMQSQTAKSAQVRIANPETEDKFTVVERKIIVPSMLQNIGVKGDESAETVEFEMSRYYDLVDLTQHNLYIDFINAGGESDFYLVPNINTTLDTMNFDWIISDKVTKFSGTVKFALRFETVTENKITYSWHSEIAQFNVLDGLSVTGEIAEKYPDALQAFEAKITGIESRIKTLEQNGTPGGADAREIELQKSETAIQWRYVGDTLWTDLVMLAEITGADGAPGEQGPKGETGEAGPEGPQGETGPAGADGKSAYQYAQDGGYTGTEEGFVQRLLQSGIKSIVGTNDAPVNAWELEPGIYQLHGKMMADSNTAVTALNHNYILFAIRQSTYGSNIVYLFSDDIGGLKIIFPDADESFSTSYVDSSELENCQFVSRKWEMPASETTAAIWPDDFYIWPEMTSLTLSFIVPESGIANIVYEYHWMFTSGATPTELVLPDTVRVPSGFVIEANKIYEMSVLENRLTYQSWDWEAEA